MDKQMVDPKEVRSETDIWLDEMAAQKAERMQKCNGVMKMSGVMGMKWGDHKAKSEGTKSYTKQQVEGHLKAGNYEFETDMKPGYNQVRTRKGKRFTIHIQ